MKDVQRIAIVDPSDATREPLRNLLLSLESVWLEAECSRYEFFIDVAKQSTPDLVVVALDADHGKALQLIQQLTVELPAMPILAVSARGDKPLHGKIVERADMPRRARQQRRDNKTDDGPAHGQCAVDQQHVEDECRGAGHKPRVRSGGAFDHGVVLGLGPIR